jgi:ribose transport system permease protein
MQRVVKALDPRRVSALYIGIVVVLVFSIWIPHLFLTTTALTTTLRNMSISGILSVGLVLPLAAGAFDLSVGWVLGMSSAIATTLMLQGVNPLLASSCAIAASVGAGVANSFVIVGLKVDSFIATLATGSIIEGIIVLVEHDQQQFGLAASFTRIGGNGPLGVAYSFYFLLALSIVVWFVLEHTPAGRYTRATGGNAEAARLAGIRTWLYVVTSLLVCAIAAGAAGLFYSATISGASPDVGGTYLLPAFAAALFGATQVRPGNPNVAGTLLAAFVLALGSEGFNLLGVQFWIQDVFFGLALILAVTIRYLERRPRGATGPRKQEPKHLVEESRRSEMEPQNV